MKKLLIIGASVLQLPGILKAKEMDLRVGVVDYNPQAIGIPYADEYFNASTMDEDAVVKAAEAFHPDGIMTLATDMPMRGVAKAATKLGLRGISYETAVKATDKFEMIKAFKEHGVPSPWFYVCPSPNLSPKGRGDGLSPDLSPKGRGDGLSPDLSPKGRGDDCCETNERFGYQTADPCLYQRLQSFAKEMRNNPTQAESAIWSIVKGNKLGYHFRRQQIIGDYIVDFVCLDKKLVLEIDGEYHNEYEQQVNDEVRTKWLNSKGFHVLRIPNAEVLGNTEQVVKKIETALKVLPLGEDLGEVNLSFPCIMKPTDNAGSHGVVLAHSFEELVNSFDYSHDCSRHGKVIVEEYLQGDEVSVEVMVVDGKAHILQITDKLTTGAPHFVEMGHSQPTRHPAPIAEAIKDVATQACAAVGINQGPAHVEMMVTKRGPVMIELGARMGGDNITTGLVPLSTGIDMVKATIDVALGNEPDIIPTLNCGSAIRYFDVPFGTIKSISGVEEAKKIPGVKQIIFTKEVGDESTPIHCSNDRIGSVIAQAETAEAAVRICEEAMKAIRIEIV